MQNIEVICAFENKLLELNINLYDPCIENSCINLLLKCLIQINLFSHLKTFVEFVFENCKFGKTNIRK